MFFIKRFTVSSSDETKQKDDISDVFSVSLINSIDFNKCFEVRPNHNIVCLNRKKFNKVINVLSNFSQYDFLNKFKNVMGSDFIKMLNDIINHKVIIPEQCMGVFIIYIMLDKYDCSMDLEFITFFNFIHIERYFEQIRSLLNIISLSEYCILFKSDIYFKNNYLLPLYLLNKGERLLYNSHCFNGSCLKKALVNDNFDLAYMLINLGCNLYENEQSFKDSALFYAMFFRNRSSSEGITEISEKQWKVIQLMITKCKTFKYQIDPVYLDGRKTVYSVSVLDKEFVGNVIDFEQSGIKACNPLMYALSGYSYDKLDFILKTHPEFISDIRQHSELYKILIDITAKYLKK